MSLRCWSREEWSCSGTTASTITPCLGLSLGASWERTFMFAKMAPDRTSSQEVSEFNKRLTGFVSWVQLLPTSWTNVTLVASSCCDRHRGFQTSWLSCLRRWACSLSPTTTSWERRSTRRRVSAYPECSCRASSSKRARPRASDGARPLTPETQTTGRHYSPV